MICETPDSGILIFGGSCDWAPTPAVSAAVTSATAARAAVFLRVMGPHPGGVFEILADPAAILCAQSARGGRMGSWVHGCMGPWVHGSMSDGSMSAWVHGSVT